VLARKQVAPAVEQLKPVSFSPHLGLAFALKLPPISNNCPWQTGAAGRTPLTAR